MRKKTLAKAVALILCGFTLWLLVAPYVLGLGSLDETVNAEGYRSFVSWKSWLGILLTMLGVVTVLFGTSLLF
jgi:hypothetical protein